jgi:hypothetical protein
MRKYEFGLGGSSGAEFICDGEGLRLSVTKDKSVYTMRFLDSVTFDTPAYSRNEDEYTKASFCEKTVFSEDESTLTSRTEMDKGVTLYNRFVMERDVARIRMYTWATTEDKLYDTAITVAKLDMDMSGFSEVSGGYVPGKFPVTMTAPHVGLKEKMAFSGDGRYMEIYGGMISRVGSIIEAHLSSNFFNDDITYFNEENPIETVFAFEKCEREMRVFSPTVADDAEQIKSGDIAVSYRVKPDGVAFVSLGRERPMTAMLVEKIQGREKIYLDTLSGWNRVNVNKGSDFIEFLLLDNKKCAPGVGVRLVANTAKINRIEWTAEAINESSEHSILWCNYPRFYFEADKVYDILVPNHGGCVEREFNRGDGFSAGAYPSGLSIVMQYFALFTEDRTRGIYYGIHDPSGGYKDFIVNSNSRGSEVLFKTRYCAENLGEPKNGFTLPGRAVWESFRGDWFDAAEIYREFVEAECDFARVSSEGRTDIPEWMLDMPFWVMDWVPMEPGSKEKIPDNLRPKEGEGSGDDWYKVPIKLREELGVPIGYHLYNWHKIPFNNDYPHYFPTKSCVPEGLAELKRAGIKVMPYINALMWDLLDRENTDYQYTEIAKPSAVKRRDGGVKGIPYGQLEKDGQPTLLSPMCPTSLMWREKLGEIVKTLFYEYGFDGVYLDQVSAHIPHPCMDKTHNHAPGGGSWWQREYRSTLRYLNSIKPKDGVLTSESNAEVYANDLDGLLSWAWIRAERCTPSFMRIYGGKTVVFGRNAGGYMKDYTLHWKYNIAEGLLSGEQMGWVNSDFVNDPDRLDFVRRLVRFRYENRIFFRRARPMRTPRVLADEDGFFTSGIGMNCQGILYTTYMRVGMLECGKQRMLIAVNIKNEEITERVELDPGVLPEELSVSGNGSYERLGDGLLSVTVPGGGLVAIMWEEK